MIAEFERDSLQIRGVPIGMLIENMTFVDSILFTLTGHNPDPCVSSMLNGVLVAWVDHGENPPSTQNVRNVASSRGSFAAACMAGIATFGGAHVPIEQAALFLAEMEIRSEDEESQADIMRKWKRIPGLGHPVHDRDPRVGPLLKLAAHNLTDLRHLSALHRAERLLAKLLPGEDSPPVANLAGVTAAIWLDLGFAITCVGLLPIIGRAVGWSAHYAEQRSLPAFAGSIPQ